MTERSLRAVGGGLVSINLHPTHAAYRRFLTLGSDGLLPLGREAYAALDADLAAACRGLLTRHQGAALFERVVDATVRHLPDGPPSHPMREAVLEYLDANPEAELADLAGALGLSYSRMSHVFKKAVGLPFRACQGALRLRLAGRQFSLAATLTGIAHASGFTDSAHLSHTWRRCYGLPPSYVRDDHCVQVVS